MEEKTGLIIQARMGSKRLPGKSNLKIKGKTVLNWVISTAKTVKGVDKIILATSENNNCDCLEELAKKEGISCVRGSEENVLSRFVKAIKEFDLDYIIRITADDICHDPNLIEYALKDFLYQNSDYLISSTEENLLIDGLGFEILKSNLLLNVFQKKDLSDEDKEHVTIYIRNQRIKFNQAFINKANIPEIYKDKFNFKLCIDTYDDFINMKDAWSTITNYKNIDIGDTRQIILNMISKSKL